MAEEWFWGVYATGMGDPNIDGSIDLNANKLAWVKDTDNADEDINSGDTATIAIAKRYMTDWATKLKAGRNSLVCVDTDPAVAWNSGKKIKFFGVITKLNPKHKDNLIIRADNQLAIFKRQVPCTLTNAESTKPSDGVTFTGLTDQALMGNIIRHGFNTALFPAGQRPANILGTVSGVSTGDTKKLTTLHSENKSIADLLINYRDSVSTYGNEFRFLPVFTSSSMNLIRLNAWIGEDSVAGAHLNESQTVTINIETPSQFNKMIELSVVHNLDGVATRWIVHTKVGDETTDSGSDLVAKSNTSTDLPRLDSFFNPGVELTTAERDAQATAHLNASAAFAEATFSTEEDFNTDWKDNLGKTINFVGAAGTEYADFNMTVRCVSLGWSGSNGSVNVGLVVPQPRYPLLPKDRLRGKTGNDNNSPIVTPKNPNVPKPGGGGFPTFPTDDWDAPKLGEDKAPPIDINWKAAGGSTFRPYYTNKLWGDVDIYRVGEGHNLIPDDANGRFISLSASHFATMWRDKSDGRGTIPSLQVKKTKKFVNKPNGIIDGNLQDYNYTDTQLGLEGIGGIIANLDWADIEPHILSDTADGKALTYELFNFGLYIRGPVDARIVTIFGHQLQLLSGGGSAKLRSRNLAWDMPVNANYEAQGGWTYTDNHIFSGNAGYDGKTSFYAYGSSIGFDTSGTIDNIVVMTPRGYPQEVDIPDGTPSKDYWASINMGQYATFNIALVKDWKAGKLHSSVGPSTPGKDYEDVNAMPIPGIDWSVKVYNTFSCNVIDDNVYATAVTGFGKITETTSQSGLPSGTITERLIARAKITFKPATGVGPWEELFSGNQSSGMTGFAGKQKPRTVGFYGTVRRNSGEIAFTLLGPKDGDYRKQVCVLAKNDTKSVREINDKNVPTTSLMYSMGSWQRYTYGQGYDSQEAFSDLMNFAVADDGGTPNILWLRTPGLSWARFTWGGTVSNYSQTYNQGTSVPRSLMCNGFSVGIDYSQGAFAPGGDNKTSFIFWYWE